MSKVYHTLTATDGVPIFYISSIPEPPQGIVVICHGYGGHSGQYDHFTGELLAKGYGVYAYDQRGHGRSPAERGHLDNFLDMVGDLHTVIEYIITTHPGVPLFTLGHSMGGLVSFLYGNQHPELLHGQIFSAPAVGKPWGTQIIPDWFFRVVRTYFSHVNIPPIIKRTSCSDPDFMRALRQDPLVLKKSTAGFFCEFIHCGITMAQSQAAHYSLPCLFLHGKSDKIIPYRSSVELFARIQSIDKTLQLYDHLYHELLQEPAKALVITDILAWLEHRTDII